MTTPRVSLGKDKRKGRWRADVTWPDGSRSRHLLPVRLSEDATAELAAFERDELPDIMIARTSATDIPAPRGTTTLRSMADWYLETHLPVKGASPHTAARYAPCIWSFVNYMASRHVARVNQLSTRLIEEWQLQVMRDKTKTTPSRSDIVNIRRWLGICEEAGECGELPAVKWNVPKKTRGTQHTAYPPAITAAWATALSEWRPMVGIVARWVAATGWRIADALDFRVGEIDRARGRIDRAQLKTDADLPYPLTAPLLAIIDEALAYHRQPDPGAHVFLDATRQPWDYKALYRQVNHFNKSRWAGESISFRDLRKSFATHLAMAGCPPNVLKELMGHADIKMTLGYYIDVDMGRMSEWLERGNLGNPLATPANRQ